MSNRVRRALATSAVTGAALVLSMGALAGTAFAHGEHEGRWYAPRTVYVTSVGHGCDDDNDWDDWQGNGTWAHPYCGIQKAVNKVPSGSTIIVERGVYREEVVISNKHLTIKGQGDGDGDADDAIINAWGRDHGIVVSGWRTAGTMIEGMTVEFANKEGVLVSSTTHVTIKYNHIAYNGRYAIGITGANAANNPDYEALHLIGVTNSAVRGNWVGYNYDGGIYLTNETGPSTGNWVVNNTVEYNKVDCGITLAAHVPNAGVSWNYVENNTSKGNGAAGILIAAGAPHTTATHNRIIGNRSINNGLPGVYVVGHSAGDNVNWNFIERNYIAGNGGETGPASTHTGILVAQTAPLGYGVHPIYETNILYNTIVRETWGIALLHTYDTDIWGNDNDATVKVKTIA